VALEFLLTQSSLPSCRLDLSRYNNDNLESKGLAERKELPCCGKESNRSTLLLRVG
jgi:hypothetical protein